MFRNTELTQTLLNECPNQLNFTFLLVYKTLFKARLVLTSPDVAITLLKASLVEVKFLPPESMATLLSIQLK